MGNLIQRLLRHTFDRRQNVIGASRARPDHPEEVPPNQLPTIRKAKHNPNSSSATLATIEVRSTLEMPTKISTEADSNSIMATSIDSLIRKENCSDFYLACRSNNIDEVKRLFETITLDEIDRKEPNGSTALHAAAYHGHREIVRLLLEKGADRAIQNKYKCLPFDEAADDETKELFLRIPNTNRFVSNTGAIEWELINDDVVDTAAIERSSIKSFYDNINGLTPFRKMFEKIQKNYVEQGLTNFVRIDEIKRFFRKATEEQDPIWIIKAYTAETDFYKILNRDIAGGASRHQNERKYIIAILWHHPKLDPLSYTGVSYRVMQVNYDDLQRYQVNCLLMTKSFVSSSIDRKVAELILCRQEKSKEENSSPIRRRIDGRFIKIWVMCIYHIKHPRTALHIENYSQYAHEGEVLIMPYTVFKVKNVKPVTRSSLPEGYSMTQIELEECEVFDQEDIITRY